MFHGRHEGRPFRNIPGRKDQRLHREENAGIRNRESSVPKLPCTFLRRIRRAGTSYALHHLPDGTTAPHPYPRTDRGPGRRSQHHVQDCGRERPAPRRHQGHALLPELYLRACCRVLPDVRKHRHGVRRRHPEGSPYTRERRSRQILRSAFIRHLRPAGHRRRQGSDERTCSRQADAQAEALFHLPPLAALGALRNAS